jgi:S1-C subfamily serine protease
MPCRLAIALTLFGLLLLRVPSPAGAQTPELSPQVFLGIVAAPAPPGTERAGVMIREVAPSSPAAQAGLRSGDVIAKVDDQEVKDFAALINTLTKHKPGDQLTFQVLRGGKEQSLRVTLAARPAPRVSFFERESQRAFLGVEIRELTLERKNRLGVTVDAGAVIAEVGPGTPAEKAGLRPGDVITRVDDQGIANPEDLQKAIRQAGVGKEVTLKVARSKEQKELKARLEAERSEVFAPPFFSEGRTVIQRLEQRLEELEKRISELEQKLKERSQK